MADRVVDASVAAALFFREPREEAAAAMMLGAGPYAPTLLPYEPASVARRKVAAAPSARDDLELALATALETEIALVEVGHVEVVELALETGLTTYDASYLYLSDLLGIPLLTFDARLKEAAEGDAPEP